MSKKYYSMRREASNRITIFETINLRIIYLKWNHRANKAFIIQTKMQLWRKFSFLLFYAIVFCHVLKTEAILNVLNTVISDHIGGKDCFHTSANTCWLFPLFTLIGCEQICDSAKFTVSNIQDYYASKWLRIRSVNEPFE